MITPVEPGARWLRCDLHVHTPFDHARTFGENLEHAIDAFRRERPAKLAEIAGRFIDACRQGADGEGIDLVALTDHNSIAGYRYLKPFFEGIGQQARDGGLPMPVILPGVEFSVGGERPLHFLVVFAARTAPDEIEGAIRHVFGEHEPFDPKTGTARTTGNSVDDFLKKLYGYCRPSSGDRRLSFIVVPAHADSSRGIADEIGGGQLAVAATLWDEMKGHLRQWVITRQDWHGFQTVRPYRELPPAFRDLLARWASARRGVIWDELEERERTRIRESDHWPLIECSDPHRYEEIGTCYCWLKMEVADVEGIRLALLDPASRLRRLAAGTPAHAYPVIRRLQIRKTDFLEEIEIPLSPCLNTLIGGRGAGKSTVLECVRYVLDRARTADFDEDEVEIRDTVDGFLTLKETRDYGETKGMLLPGHVVVADLEVAGRSYRISRSEAGIEILPEGEGMMPALDVRALVAPRVLSQRQIARIARDPAAQRRELDALADVEMVRRFGEQKRALLEDVERLQAKRRGLQARAETLPARETELQTAGDQIGFLERGGNEEILASFRYYQAEERWLAEAAGVLDAVAKGLEDQASEIETNGTRLGAPPPGPTAKWTQLVAERTEVTVVQANQAVTASVRALRELADLVATERETQWQPGFAKAQAAYTELRQEMEEKGVEFSQHEQLLHRRAELEAEVEELRALPTELDEVERSLFERHSAHVRLHEERLANRRALAANLEGQDADIRLDVVAFGDRPDFAARKDKWFAGAGLQERDWDVLVDFVFAPDGAIPDRLHNLIQALRQDVAATRTSGRTLEPTNCRTATLLGEDAERLTRNFFNTLQRSDRIRLDELERFLPEDRVDARVRGVDGIFKPIEQGSIGQKSTAILALLLSAGDQPLIIDQPEDDLDNQYVYDVVVDLLRSRKFSRQILIATHNANVPVNGDAELIVALGVESRLGTILTAGSIDRADVKEAVTAIMEGSAEAFRLRQERYGY